MSVASSSASILITGGGGFIGAAAAQAFARDGYAVHSGVRRAARGSALAIACDLDKPSEIASAIAGTRLVIHAAYGDYAAMPAQCRNLLAAMESAGVENLIYLSSIAVYGARAGEIDETAAPEGPLDAYARAKIECESIVRDWAAKGTRRAIILRPGIVYGAASPFWIVKLSERIRRGVWGVFGAAGEGPAPLVHVDDVVAMIGMAGERLLSATRETIPRAAIFNAVSPEMITWNAYFAAVAKAIGAPPLVEMDSRAIASRRMLSLAAKVWRRAGLPGGEGLALAPAPAEVAMFSRRAKYRMDAARDILGFEPRVEFAEGLARCFNQEKA